MWKCKGRIKLLALVTGTKYLGAVGEPTDVPARSPIHLRLIIAAARSEPKALLYVHSLPLEAGLISDDRLHGGISCQEFGRDVSRSIEALEELEFVGVGRKHRFHQRPCFTDQRLRPCSNLDLLRTYVSTQHGYQLPLQLRRVRGDVIDPHSPPVLAVEAAVDDEGET